MPERYHRGPTELTRRETLRLAAACFGVLSGSSWNHVPAAPPGSRPAVVVLDDCDPNFLGKVEGHNDGLRLLTADGKETRRIGGLSNCESIARNHGIALDPERGRIYARELVAHRIMATDLAGRVVWRVDSIHASAMAVDPENGDLWCLVDDGTIKAGELVVLDLEGNRRAHHPVRGVDIAYDPHHQAFRVVGEDLVRLDRRGKDLLNIPNFAAWSCSAVAPIPGRGEAWLVERKHPQVAASRGRVVRVSSDGEIRQSLERDDWNPFGVACEPGTGQAWVVDLRKALVRVPIGEDPREPLPIPALAVAIGSNSGQIWVATRDHVIRLKYGVPVVRFSLGKPSGQVWLSAF
jgi:hypothetical protein